MAPRKTAAEADAETEAPVETPAEEVAEKTAKPSKTEVVVKYRDHRGEVTERTFSKEVHGPDFAKLADEFKATNAKQCEGLN